MFLWFFDISKKSRRFLASFRCIERICIFLSTSISPVINFDVLFWNRIYKTSRSPSITINKILENLIILQFDIISMICYNYLRTKIIFFHKLWTVIRQKCKKFFNRFYIIFYIIRIVRKFSIFFFFCCLFLKWIRCISCIIRKVDLCRLIKK